MHDANGENGGNGGNGENGVRKLLRDGHIVIILPDGREFDATGAKMRSIRLHI